MKPPQPAPNSGDVAAAGITEDLPRTASIVFCPDCRSYLQPPPHLAPRRARVQGASRFVPPPPHPPPRPPRPRRAHLDRAPFQAPQAPPSRPARDPPRRHPRTNPSRRDHRPRPSLRLLRPGLPRPVDRRRPAPPEHPPPSHLPLPRAGHPPHRAAAKTIRTDCGLDFYFSSRSHADRFIDFIAKIVPIRHTELVSHDEKSTNYTFSVEICPICREDLICLPRELSHSLGSLGPLVICTKVSNSITLLDPTTLRAAFLDANQYWRTGFTSHLSSRQLVDYIVLDIRMESPEVVVAGTKYQLATVEVARASDSGKNDNVFTVTTHIGHLLKQGDYAMGYDLYGANTNDIEHMGLVLPDAVLIKKSYQEKRQKRRGRGS